MPVFQNGWRHHLRHHTCRQICQSICSDLLIGRCVDTDMVMPCPFASIEAHIEADGACMRNIYDEQICYIVLRIKYIILGLQMKNDADEIE